jgi:RNA polymerase sigma-70 factor, ECF subfamily
MTFYDDAPADAIAGRIGVSAGNVRVIRHRGLDKLRRCVDGGSARAAP